MEKGRNTLRQPPDIEEALRNPINERGYLRDYNKLLAERAISAVDGVLEGEKDKKERLRLLFEGNEGSTTVKGSIVKALSEAGLLRVASIVAENPPDNKGWFEKKRMTEWEKEFGHEIWGVVEKYYVQLPENEAQPPVTTRLILEIRQQKDESGWWGDKDYDKWTLARES